MRDGSWSCSPVKRGEFGVFKKKNGENIRGDENDSTKRGKIILKR